MEVEVEVQERRWEDMDSDCLANIFGRLDLESRLLNIPFVCKHWHRALLNPFCWQCLVFPFDFFHSIDFYEYILGVRNTKISKLIKFVVDRSQGCATQLVLPGCTTTKDLKYVSDVCPNLKLLSLPYFDFSDIDIGVGTLAEFIVKWKSLEILKVNGCCYHNMEQIINEIGANCNSFVGLYLSNSIIGKQVALAIVSKIKNIKLLVLDYNYHVEKENLVQILQGCRQLEVLHVRDCKGFDEHDEEILNLASHIKDFCFAGSETILRVCDTDDSEDF